MVSLGTIVTIGGLAAAYLIFQNAGGGKGIGQSIGSAISGLGAGVREGLSGVTQGVNRFGNLVETPQSNAESLAQRIVEQNNLGEYVTNIPQNTTSLSSQQRGGLTYAGFLEANNLGGTINLRTNEFKNQYGIQPLDFTINGSGGINTGSVGLSQATLNAQAALSKEYGIPTFDTKGNLSTFGGLVTGN
jgi:hypothetical protein|tara:strand:- start:245 stop:811 length:567 start_codon:yes stop_codon:yes gene_type:complete